MRKGGGEPRRFFHPLRAPTAQSQICWGHPLALPQLLRTHNPLLFCTARSRHTLATGPHPGSNPRAVISETANLFDVPHFVAYSMSLFKSFWVPARWVHNVTYISMFPSFPPPLMKRTEKSCGHGSPFRIIVTGAYGRTRPRSATQSPTPVLDSDTTPQSSAIPEISQ